MTARYGIEPDRLYSEAELDVLGFRTRSQRNRLRAQKRFPQNFPVTPGRKATVGHVLLDYLEHQMAEAVDGPEFTGDTTAI